MPLDWQTQVDAFLANYEGITLRRYRDSLAAFQACTRSPTTWRPTRSR